jgi:ISXO2 transposase-like protein
MQIRAAMAETEQRTLLQGVVEVDETYVGGKPRKGNTGNGGVGGGTNKRGQDTKKIPVVGMVSEAAA